MMPLGKLQILLGALASCKNGGITKYLRDLLETVTDVAKTITEFNPDDVASCGNNSARR
jgi:hypothetical protein